MLCETCHDKEATVHLTQVIDGAVKKIHLCEGCASESGFDIQGPLSITDILLGMDGEQTAPSSASSKHECPACGMSQGEFKKTGRLGCPVCYETFAGDLVQLVNAIHRGDEHVGKIPSREGVRARFSGKLSALQKRLDQAVTREQFEEAAKIRDKIRSCRKELTEAEKKALS